MTSNDGWAGGMWARIRLSKKEKENIDGGARMKHEKITIPSLNFP